MTDFWRFLQDAAAIGIGGAVGANARYWLGKWISSHHWGSHFPIGTILINVTGSALLGILIAVFSEKAPTPQRFWLLLLGTGFCGGYTTFSTFSYETFELIDRGKWALAFVNVGVSVAVGFAVVVFAASVLRQR